MLLTRKARGRGESCAAVVFAREQPATCGEQPRSGSEMTRTAHCTGTQGSRWSLGTGPGDADFDLFGLAGWCRALEVVSRLMFAGFEKKF